MSGQCRFAWPGCSYDSRAAAGRYRLEAESNAGDDVAAPSAAAFHKQVQPLVESVQTTDQEVPLSRFDLVHLHVQTISQRRMTECQIHSLVRLLPHCADMHFAFPPGVINNFSHAGSDDQRCER